MWHQSNAVQALRMCISAVAIALSLAGCAAVAPKLESPKITLISVNMMSADIFNQQFRLRMHVDNPNARDLPIKQIDFKLFLEGDAFADGMSNAPFVAPASGSTEFDVIVSAHFVSGLGRLLSRINGNNSNSIHYDVVGKVNVDKAFVPMLEFKQSGVVELLKK